MDWYGNRFNETYKYVKVSPQNWSEVGTYDYITSGSIEMSEDSNFKITGSFGFEGPEVPDPNYYLRVYYSFTDDDENYDQVMLGTFLISVSSLKYKDTTTGTVFSGTVNANSILKVLDDKKYGEPFIIKKNQNAIYKAALLIQDQGFRVNFTPSSKSVSADHTFEGGASYLEIVNWLCEFAEYRSAFVDSEGVIQLQPEIKPENQKEMIVFRDDRQSIMYPEIDEDNDWQSRANVVRLVYNTDKAYGIATVKNLSGSRMSLDSLNGREITYYEEVGDVDRGEAILKQLLDKGEKILRDEANETEYVTFSHAYVPIELLKAVKIEYSDFIWVGAATNISISLSAATKTQTKIKKVIESQIEVERTGRFKATGSDSFDTVGP